MNYTLTLTAEETQLIINTLAEKPYNQVHQLVARLVTQVEHQRKPQPVPPEIEDTKEPEATVN